LAFPYQQVANVILDLRAAAYEVLSVSDQRSPLAHFSLRDVHFAQLITADNRAAFKASRRSSFCFTLRQRQASSLVFATCTSIS
jgi:hypothetical protein